jgi:tetratricopeptide (TPR) repeat protein
VRGCFAAGGLAPAAPGPAISAKKPESVTVVVLSSLVLLLLVTAASAESPRLKNIESCNTADRASPEPQIAGCTALIESGKESAQVLAIAYNNRGNAYAAKGELDRAIRDYDQAIQHDPKSARTLNNRGVAYRKKGDHDRALSDFDDAIKLDQSYAKAFANRANTYEQQGEYAHAARDYVEAARLDAGLQPAWHGSCWTRAIVGELHEALADCNRALQITQSAAVLAARGLVHLKMDQLDAAIADYNSALQSEPRLASALYGRGLARRKKGDTVAGDADIAAAIAVEASIADEFARYGVR